MDEYIGMIAALLLLLVGVFFVIRMVLGQRVADNLIARLLYDLFTLPFRLVWFIVKLILRRH